MPPQLIRIAEELPRQCEEKYKIVLFNMDKSLRKKKYKWKQSIKNKFNYNEILGTTSQSKVVKSQEYIGGFIKTVRD